MRTIRKHLYEGFDFNDSEATAEAEASKDVKKLKKFYEDLPKIKSWLESLTKNGFINGSYEVTPDGINVDGGVDLRDQYLKSIPYKFNIVTNYFICAGNELKTLEGSPNEVGGYFDCSYNQLTSLKGGPQIVGSSIMEFGLGFDCEYNNLTSLEGAPKYVGKSFNCRFNYDLTSLKGLPKYIGGDLWCDRNENLTIDKDQIHSIVKGTIHKN